MPPRDSITVDGRPERLRADAAMWTLALRAGRMQRAAMLDAQRPTYTALAGAAARYGIVPDPTDPDARQRAAELADAYGGWRAQAINAHAWMVWDAQRDRDLPAALAAGPDVVDFRGWPGDLAADYDASAERFNLSPSGPWSRPATFPPVYLSGWMPAWTPEHVYTGRKPDTVR